MTYTIKKANNVLEIKEREYASAKEIKFTKFTSCIGVLAIVDHDQVLGIHLTIKDEKGNTITEKDSEQVIHLIPAHSSEIKVIGQISVWDHSVKTVYEYLLKELKTKSNKVEQYPFADGVYGGKVENGEIEITY